MAGDKDAGTNGIDGGIINSLRKLFVLEDEDSPSDMTIGALGLVDVCLTDAGGSGKGHEGGGESGGKDFLDIIHGDVYKIKESNRLLYIDKEKKRLTLRDMPRLLL